MTVGGSIARLNIDERLYEKIVNARTALDGSGVSAEVWNEISRGLMKGVSLCHFVFLSHAACVLPWLWW